MHGADVFLANCTCATPTQRLEDHVQGADPQQPICLQPRFCWCLQTWSPQVLYHAQKALPQRRYRREGVSSTIQEIHLTMICLTSIAVNDYFDQLLVRSFYGETDCRTGNQKMSCSTIQY